MSDTATKPGKTRKPNIGSDPTKGSRIRLWQVGLYAFAIGTSLVLVLVTLSYILRGRFPRIFLMVTVLVCGLSWGLVTNKVQAVKKPAGRKLESTEPKLTAFIAAVAAEIGVAMPDAIYLVNEAKLSLTERTRNFGREIDDTFLTIGLPNLHLLTKQEFAAALAHEFGHLAESDVESGAEAFRSLKSAQELIRIERQGFINGVYGSYARKMFRGVGGVGVAHEEAADRRAAELYGTDALVSALHKEDEASVAFDQLLREYVVPSLQEQKLPAEMYAGFRHVVDSPARVEQRARDLERHTNRDHSEFLLHRRATDRLEKMSDWAHQPGQIALPGGDESAATLLDPSVNSTKVVIDAWASKLTGEATTDDHSWQELTEDVYSQATYTAAAAGFADETTPQAMLDQALAWSTSGDWTELDAAIKKPMKKVKGAAARRSEWARSVVLEAAVATGGWTWQHNWDGPPQLVDSGGKPLDAVAIAGLIVDGDAEAASAAFDQAVAVG